LWLLVVVEEELNTLVVAVLVVLELQCQKVQVVPHLQQSQHLLLQLLLIQ